MELLAFPGLDGYQDTALRHFEVGLAQRMEDADLDYVLTPSMAQHNVRDAVTIAEVTTWLLHRRNAELSEPPGNRRYHFIMPKRKSAPPQLGAPGSMVVCHAVPAGTNLRHVIDRWHPQSETNRDPK